MILQQRVKLILAMGIITFVLISPLDAVINLLIVISVGLGLFLWPSKEERDE